MRDEALRAAVAQPVVEVRDLRFTYPDGLEALKGVDLVVRAGEKVAVTGPNGAGKSTLFLHLNGILRGNGHVRIQGMPITEENLGRIRGLVGLVFQDPDDQLFSPTVFEDVAFGPLHMGLPEDEVRRRVSWALKQVGMDGHEGRMPHHFSLGQRKRVAIATVLSMDPAILVLDEPTSGLDPRTRRGLISLLQELRRTLLIATHDMRLVRDVCERTVIMDEGRIVADGPTAHILADVDLLERHGLEPP
jgi:cobalt transport protein ATP-binding subunit